jgi:hypothetical protein
MLLTLSCTDPCVPDGVTLIGWPFIVMFSALSVRAVGSNVSAGAAANLPPRLYWTWLLDPAACTVTAFPVCCQN